RVLFRSDLRRMGGRRVEVGHRQEWIRRRLEPDELHARGRRTGLVELEVAQPPPLELRERDAGAVVRALGERDRVARREQGEHEGDRKSGARGKAAGMPAVELADSARELAAGR